MQAHLCLTLAVWYTSADHLRPCQVANNRVAPQIVSCGMPFIDVKRGVHDFDHKSGCEACYACSASDRQLPYNMPANPGQHKRCTPEGAPPAHPVEPPLAADAADFLHLVQI